jgi:hypothetical protein
MFKRTLKVLNRIGLLTDKYADTLSLVLISVGGLLVSVAVGELPNGMVVEGGYNFVYLKHPLTLKIGLIAIVVGFTQQLWENLVKVHGIGRRILFWPMTAVATSLMILVLAG